MSAHPGDSAEDRRPFPPFGPALSRPSPAPSDAGAGAAPLPPFAPFARPAAEPAGEIAEIEAEVAPFTPAATEAQDEAWMPWESTGDAADTHAEAPAAAQDDTEDLPWLVAEPAAPAGEAPAEVDAGSGDLPGWMSWDDAEEGAPERGEESAAEPAVADAYSFETESFAEETFDVTALGGAPVDAEPFAQVAESPSFGGEPDAWAAAAPAHVSEAEAAPGVGAAPPEDAAEEEPAAAMEDYCAGEQNAAAEEAMYAPFVEESDSASAGAAALPAGSADALAEVADRLEGIARALRERPGEVLAGGRGADPLELLITGFALGYAQGRRGGA